jgi:hypothetical protein
MRSDAWHQMPRHACCAPRQSRSESGLPWTAAVVRRMAERRGWRSNAVTKGTTRFLAAAAGGRPAAVGPQPTLAGQRLLWRPWCLTAAACRRCQEQATVERLLQHTRPLVDTPGDRMTTRLLTPLTARYTPGWRTCGERWSASVSVCVEVQAAFGTVFRVTDVALAPRPTPR